MYRWRFRRARVHLQVSLLTNAAPVHRLGGHASSFPAPAVYLTSALEVERLYQTYRRRPGPSLRLKVRSKLPLDTS
jgi:hypothetical protein